MDENNSAGSNMIWAVTLIIIVAIIAGALYYSGFLGGTKKEQIDINIDAPAATRKFDFYKTKNAFERNFSHD